MAAKYDLKIKQGETYYKTFRWLQGDGITPVNLRGYTGACQIRNGAFNQGIIVTIPVTILEAEKGRFALSLSAAETAAIPAHGYNYSNSETYAYDVEFKSPNGTVCRVLNGPAVISPEVTK